jgi:anaerobic selenocysteine-containing dehydrogenase
MARTVHGACQHDCPDTCAWSVVVQDGDAIGLRARPDHPFTRGALCQKTHDYLRRRVYREDRLLTPLRRVGAKGSGSFEPVSWPVALAEIAQRLRRAIEQHGAEAVMPFSHQGSMGIVQERSIDRRLFARLGATHLERDVCGYVTSAGLEAVNGADVGVLPEDLRHSRFIVLWSTNTLLTNPHLWRIVQQARRDGAVVVTVDPLRTITAERSDWHIRPRPGTDDHLALGVAHVLLRDGLVDEAFVRRRVEGYAAFAQLARGHPPERASAATGVPAQEIVRFAHAYATTRPAAIRLLLGLEKHANGARMASAIAALPALTGAWRDPGGGILHLTAALHLEALDMDAVTRPDLLRPDVRRVHWAQLGRALTQLDGPRLHALLVYNSNPATTAPNQHAVLAGLAREDLLLVVHEQVLTDTARYADYVLPATTMVEHWDLLRAYGHTQIALNEPAIAPRGDAVSITELFRRLAAALELDHAELYDDDRSIIRAALASGHPWLEGIDVERLWRDGWASLALPRPWRPFAAGFPTPSGRCRLPADPPVEPAAPGDYPLQLIATKQLPRHFNSTYGEADADPGPLPLDIALADAAARGLADGARVRVASARGTIAAVARVGDRVPDGVVALPFGRWRSQGRDLGVNVLTRDGLSDRGGGGDFYDTRVEVAADGG